MTQKAFAIAIDGPVASGKGTIAQLLATQLHGFHLNTGAMYRCLGLYCLEHGISLTDTSVLLHALAQISISLSGQKVYLNDSDVTERIQDPVVAQAASTVGTIAAVREEMVKRQRAIGLEKIAKGQIVLVEGRDAATKIFPDAPLKIFLTASVEIRAKRRFAQINAAEDFEAILEDTKKRDYQDTHRQADPLVANPQRKGYLVIDDSHLSKHDTIVLLLKEIQPYL